MDDIPLQTCMQCAQVITAGYIMDARGPYHPWCHTQKAPFVPKQTFLDVLQHGDEQALVRELLCELVPEPLQERLVAMYNTIMQRRERQAPGEEE